MNLNGIKNENELNWNLYEINQEINTDSLKIIEIGHGRTLIIDEDLKSCKMIEIRHNSPNSNDYEVQYLKEHTIGRSNFSAIYNPKD